MAKIKRTTKWDTCPYALFPFGPGMPICAYGVKSKKDIGLKDFFRCMENGMCRKEEEEKRKAKNEEYADGTIRPDGQFKGQISFDELDKQL